MQSVANKVLLICSIPSDFRPGYWLPSSSIIHLNTVQLRTLKFEYFLTMIYAPSVILAAAIAFNIVLPSLAIASNPLQIDYLGTQTSSIASI